MFFSFTWNTNSDSSIPKTVFIMLCLFLLNLITNVLLSGLIGTWAWNIVATYFGFIQITYIVGIAIIILLFFVVSILSSIFGKGD